MIGVKIKDIRGAAIEKKMHPLNCVGKCSCVDASFNKAIDQQSEVAITLNREKLAGHLFMIKKGLNAPENEQVMIFEECYREADAIISKQHELLEVVK